ncbi:MAG: energy transducer TonB [Deltaproteobacteria bacterium]
MAWSARRRAPACADAEPRRRCTAAAVRWAKEKWRFTPAKAGDQPVGMWITVPVTFVLDR